LPGEADVPAVQGEQALAAEAGRGEQQQGAVAQAGQVAGATSGHAGKLRRAGRRAGLASPGV